jgi:hypothetical protein
MEFLHMSSSQFRQFRSQSKSKYGAQKTVINGIKYDSKRESKRGQELEYLEKIGKIINLQRQVKFELQPGFINNNKEKIRPIYYLADFVYEEKGQKIVEDSKGFRTKDFILKKKMFMYKYPEYKFIES